VSHYSIWAQVKMKLILRTNGRKGLLQFERTQLTGGAHLSSYNLISKAGCGSDLYNGSLRANILHTKWRLLKGVEIAYPEGSDESRD